MTDHDGARNVARVIVHPAGARSESAVGPRDPDRGLFPKFVHWLSLRDPAYIVLRLMTLLRRYGFTAGRAKKRTLDCVERLARHDCHPTFPTPGSVVGRHEAFSRDLQRRGVELSIHGYDHLDFRALSAEESFRQFARAAAAYEIAGVSFDGFRCPYLSYTERLNDCLPDHRFRYSSNKAIWWDVVRAGSPGAGGKKGAIFDALSRFYSPESSDTHVAVPRMSGGLVEIPVCIPDDLQLLDGLQLDGPAAGRAWIEILLRTHQRGELFDLMFHPESFDRSGAPLEAVLREARTLYPAVWLAQLRDVSRWWREKSRFTVQKSPEGSGLRLRFHCSERGTILVRNVPIREKTRRWCGTWRILQGRTLLLGGPGRRPFIGVAPGTPAGVVAFLKDQGYLLETGPPARECSLYLGPADCARTEVQLIASIEASAAPLVRYWRWPSGARSGLCVTGDLDALSLTDYTSRLFAS